MPKVKQTLEIFEILNNLNPNDQLKLDQRVREAVDSHVREQAEKDLRGEIADGVNEDFKLAKADFNLLVSERYKEKVTKAMERYEMVSELNDKLIDNARRTKGQPTQG